MGKYDLCKQNSCYEVVYAKGLCRNCYERNRRNHKRKKKQQYPVNLVVLKDNTICEDIDHANLQRELPKLLDEILSAREQAIIFMRFYQEKTLERVANCFGMHRERVRQIEAQVMRKLRQPEHVKFFKGYAEFYA